ncbi:NAD-glutamate dehydrogenase domain-containing protein [Pseudonocardia bannensis]|uniref:NAD-glutamate dehydrogenase n=1 Tax=Pseudonocardia bannensis TaxID=630973 RepID=A0A848DRT1_9PSEU|nr:NAD-glutamate dehydrogenase domain-containing protein [Pseudonocardia bannensis]NMH95126.1 NAD-glutamate dehydrogenase [Pseudonocardia bannensis]
MRPPVGYGHRRESALAPQVGAVGGCQRILELPRDDHWEALAKGALRDSLYAVHASLTAEVLRTGEPGTNAQDRVRRWLGRSAATTNRCVRVLDDIAGGGRADLAALTVALREVDALAQAGPPGHR